MLVGGLAENGSVNKTRGATDGEPRIVGVILELRWRCVASRVNRGDEHCHQRSADCRYEREESLQTLPRWQEGLAESTLEPEVQISHRTHVLRLHPSLSSRPTKPNESLRITW